MVVKGRIEYGSISEMYFGIRVKVATVSSS